MSPLSQKELEEQLSIAGESLVQPPSRPNELLPLLDRIEELLSKVGQSPAKSMQSALSPIAKALVVEELLKHSDGHVKVGVASCTSEIIRITAPDAPYDDDKLKVVFQLIVSSFKNLSDIHSRSYRKRTNMLETMAKVRSCVIMLDLGCDKMVIDMFQHFLKAIRSYHAEIIFKSMESIMTIVFEESDDISPQLLFPILTTLKRSNEAAKPTAKKLAEQVIQNSGSKLRPYLIRTIKSLDTSFNEYSEIVASLCQGTTDRAAHSDKSTLNDQPGEVETLRNELHATQIRVTQLQLSNIKLTEEIQSTRAKCESLENRVRELEMKNSKVEELLRLVAKERDISSEDFWKEQKAQFLKSSEFLDHIQIRVLQCLNYGQAQEEVSNGPPFEKDVTVDNALDLEGWDAIDDLGNILG